jgi:hypothetical protein
MSRQPRGRQCPRCGELWPRATQTCPDDGTDLVRRRWTMTAERHRMLRGLAFQQKGLSDAELHDRMQRLTTKESTKDLTRRDFWRLIYDLRALPDVQQRRAA